MGRRVLGLGVTLLLFACAKESPPPRASEALERSARMLARLDQLEADLHDERSKLAVYGELEHRHSQTSQIACQVALVANVARCGVRRGRRRATSNAGRSRALRKGR